MKFYEYTHRRLSFAIYQGEHAIACLKYGDIYAFLGLQERSWGMKWPLIYNLTEGVIGYTHNSWELDVKARSNEIT